MLVLAQACLTENQTQLGKGFFIKETSAKQGILLETQYHKL